ncbi:hypothetical protein ACFL5K_03000 [Gemmatimonadota bacterium]
MKMVLQAALIILCLFFLAITGCKDYLYSPFLNPSNPSNPSTPVAGLEITAENGGEIEEDCTTILNLTDSVFVLEVQVSEPSPARLMNSVVKILIEVSVGLTEGGLVLADTSQLEVDSPGDYPLVLPLENAKALADGENRISIIAITRYLDGSGYLVVPLGRKIHQCVISWQLE